MQESPASETGGFNFGPYLVALVPLVFIIAVVVRAIISASGGIAPETASMTVTLPGSAPACTAPTAAALVRQSTVFEAKAVEVAGNSVQLETQRVFAGDPGTKVIVDLPISPSPASLGLPTFSRDKTYLLAVGPDNMLAPCGLSGEETSSLRNLYTNAFGQE